MLQKWLVQLGLFELRRVAGVAGVAGAAGDTFICCIYRAVDFRNFFPLQLTRLLFCNIIGWIIKWRIVLAMNFGIRSRRRHACCHVVYQVLNVFRITTVTSRLVSCLFVWTTLVHAHMTPRYNHQVLLVCCVLLDNDIYNSAILTVVYYLSILFIYVQVPLVLLVILE